MLTKTYFMITTVVNGERFAKNRAIWNYREISQNYMKHIKFKIYIQLNWNFFFLLYKYR